MNFLHPLLIHVIGAAVLSPAEADARSQTFDANGVKIHYVIEGKGEPVVLIHGLYASAFLNWKLPGVIRELAKDYRVIALDLPGHGASGKPMNKQAYGVQMVDDVVLLLDHLKIKKAHIVGYSLGGMITLKLLAKYPERVRSALVGGMGWFRAGSSLQQLFTKVPGVGFGPPAAFFEAVGTLALSESELKKITVPVEIVIGDRDLLKQVTVVPLQRVRRDWPVVQIKDADHITCIFKQQFREEIAGWLRKNTKRQSAPSSNAR
jgi:pimeloyl-ACP methyl ester carboxylesterase